MYNVWKKYMDAIAIALKKPEIPGIIRGARGLIEMLCEEEAKIASKAIKKQACNYADNPCEDIATLINKYGNKDIYKDVYKFIKVY